MLPPAVAAEVVTAEVATEVVEIVTEVVTEAEVVEILRCSRWLFTAVQGRRPVAYLERYVALGVLVGAESASRRPVI